MKTRKILTACLLLGSAFTAEHAWAQFTLFEDFDTTGTYTAGDLNGQNGWTTGIGDPSVSLVTANPIGSGNSAQLNQNAASPGATYKSGLNILNTSSASTVFMQFYLPNLTSSTANTISMNLCIDGNSAGTPPTDSSGNSQVQFNYDNNNAGGSPGGSASPFRIRGGGAFFAASLTSNGTYYQPIAGATYNLWFVIDNSADTYSLYLQGGDIATPTLLYGAATTTSTFGFRNTSSGTLNYIDIGPGSTLINTTPNPFVDNIYVDRNGANLINPTAVTEPGAFSFAVLTTVLLGHRFRHRRI
jgi:hypothetical protein